METLREPLSITHRLREGLERVATVLRGDRWSRATALSLNPTQLVILELLEARPVGLSVKAIAAHLGVSQPTATDSIAALARKGLVATREGESDRRALIVRLSPEGLALLEADGGCGRGEQALAMLGHGEQEALLSSLVKVIAHLQALDAIPVQRMCVNCRYFVPFAHPGAASPHHCKFVDAAFGQRDIRIDCRDHETADPASQAATWAAYQQGSAPTPPGN
jgi:DNA-binding MarR family transcriptional regulator